MEVSSGSIALYCIVTLGCCYIVLYCIVKFIKCFQCLHIAGSRSRERADPTVSKQIPANQAELHSVRTV